MSLPHQSLYGAAAWLRPHLPGANALKILGAFAGGIACTGIVVAWNLYPGEFFPGTEKPEHTQAAAVAPPPSIKPQAPAPTPQASVVSADAGATAQPAEAPATKPVETAQQPADTANKSGCENQTWPYIDQRCLTKAEADAASSASVRIVSTDKTIASDPTPTPSRAAEARSFVAEQQNSPIPGHVTAALPIPLPPLRPESGTTQQTASAPPAASPAPPWTQPATTGPAATTGAAPANVASAPESAEPPPPPETRSRSRSADKRRHRREERLVRRDDGNADRGEQRSFDRRDDDRGGQRGFDRRDEGRLARRQNGNDDDSRRSRHRGREVTVEQTYRLPDGRRVVVRRAYRPGTEPDLRAMPERDLRNVEASYDRGASRYQRFVADDD